MQTLVLDGHSRAAVETAQALGRCGVAVDVHANREDCLAFHSRYVRHKFCEPAANSASKLAERIHSLDAQHCYDLIVPSTEASLLAVKDMGPTDPVRVKAVLPSRRALEIALDKQCTWELARHLGIRVPRSVLLQSTEEKQAVDHFPIVLKPTQSKVAVHKKLETIVPVIVNNPQQRRAILYSWLPYTKVLQQEYIRGHGIGVEFLFNNGKKMWHFAHERIHELPLTGGGSTYRRSLSPEPELLASAEKLLTELNWHGIAMVEFRREPNGAFCLMEINPRLWGSIALAIDAGVNFPLGLLLIANSQPLPPQPKYKVGYYSRDLAGDIEWQKQNLCANHRDPMLLTRPALISLVEYLRPLIGQESWDHFDIRDPRIAGYMVINVTWRIVRLTRTRLGMRLFDRHLIRAHRRLVRDKKWRSSRPERILFLCYGNVCRSPFAEYLARNELAGLQIQSAGLHGGTGRTCPENVLSAAGSMGIDLSEYRSQRVTQEQVDNADIIIVMDSANYRCLTERHPAAVPRTTLLGLFSSTPIVSIADPYGTSIEVTLRVMEQIRSAILGLAEWIGSLSPRELEVRDRTP